MSPNIKTPYLYVGVFLVVLPWIVPLIYGPNPLIVVQVIAICSIAVLYLLPISKFQVVLYGLILAAAINALVGILQYLFLADIFYPYLVQIRPGEAYGMLGQRNQLASLTTIGYICILVGHEAKIFNTKTSENYALSMLVFLAIGNAISLSRTGLVQWGAIFLIQIVLARGRWTEGVKLALIASAAYCVAIFLMPYLLTLMLGQNYYGLLSRFGEEGDCGARISLWRNVIDLIADRPVLGWGWGELKYAHFTTLFSENRFCGVLGNAHNLILHLAVELGIPAALTLTFLTLRIVFLQRPWVEIVPEKRMAWWILLAIGIHSMLEYPLWHAPFQMVAIICVFMIFGGKGMAEMIDQEELLLRRSMRGVWIWAGMVTLFMFMGYVAWDYFRISKVYRAEYMQTSEARRNTILEARNSYFFRRYVDFGELSVTPLDSDNALYVNELSKKVLHFSPEPKIIKLLIESAWLLQNSVEVEYYMLRFEVAFPRDYRSWIKMHPNIYNSLPSYKNGVFE